MKNNYDKIEDFILSIKANLDNTELSDYITSKLRNFLNRKGIKIKRFTNSIELFDKKSNDLFTLKLIPNIDSFNTIKTSYTCWDKRHTENKTINLGYHMVSVTENEVNNFIASDNVPLSLGNKNSVRNYINDQMIYQYNFESNTYYKPSIESSFAWSEEIFVSNNKEAVKKLVSINQGNSCGKTEVSFSKSNCFDIPNFSTKYYPKKFYMYYMHSINENEFNNFILDECVNNEYTYIMLNKDKIEDELLQKIYEYLKIKELTTIYHTEFYLDEDKKKYKDTPFILNGKIIGMLIYGNNAINEMKNMIKNNNYSYRSNAIDDVIGDTNMFCDYFIKSEKKNNKKECFQYKHFLFSFFINISYGNFAIMWYWFPCYFNK